MGLVIYYEKVQKSQMDLFD